MTTTAKSTMSFPGLLVLWITILLAALLSDGVNAGASFARRGTASTSTTTTDKNVHWSVLPQVPVFGGVGKNTAVVRPVASSSSSNRRTTDKRVTPSFAAYRLEASLMAPEPPMTTTSSIPRGGNQDRRGRRR